MWCANCCDVGENGGDAIVNPVDQLPLGSPAPQKAPEEPQTAVFKAALEKQAPDQPVGLHLERSGPEMIFVVGLRKGSSPTEAYNAQAGEPEKIAAGDYVMAVNGISGDSKKMIEEVKKAVQLELEVRHPTKFFVELEKPADTKIGLSLSHADHGTSLVVDGVKEGSVQVWNILNPQLEVRSGDRILSINHETGTAQELLKLLGADTKVRLEISRPAGLE